MCVDNSEHHHQIINVVGKAIGLSEKIWVQRHTFPSIFANYLMCNVILILKYCTQMI